MRNALIVLLVTAVVSGCGAPGSGIKSDVVELLKQQVPHRRSVLSAEEKIKLMVDRSGPLGKSGAVEAWSEALNLATKGKGPSGKALFVFLLLEYPSLWKGEEFQAARSAEYIARIKRLPAGTIDAWQAALNSATDDTSDEADTAMWIVTQDRLFDGEKLREKEASTFLTRIRSIPQAAIKSWAESAHHSELFATLSLMQLDSLFAGNRFQENVFPEALQTLKEVRAQKAP